MWEYIPRRLSILPTTVTTGQTHLTWHLVSLSRRPPVEKSWSHPREAMSQFSSEDEAELQSLLRELLKSVKDRISGAPSVECAEEILLHLEETDKNFHKWETFLFQYILSLIVITVCLIYFHALPLFFSYKFVKYLRAYVESSLGTVIEEATENFTRGDSHAIGTGQDTLVHAVTKRTRESAQYVFLWFLLPSVSVYDKMLLRMFAHCMMQTYLNQCNGESKYCQESFEN